MVFVVSTSALAKQRVVVTSDDSMQFDLKEFTVVSGEMVELVLKNTGKLPKIAMGHNLVILNKGISPLKFGPMIMGMGASPTNPLPEASLPDVFAATRLLGPGESDTIRFTAPEPGEYQFACTFPGHYAMMRGVMVVKEAKIVN